MATLSPPAQPTQEDLMPHGTLNFAILFAASATNALLLWKASHTDSIATMLACAVIFSFTNNTLFSLVHEAVHRAFSRSKPLNELGGILASGWFPTGFAFQRVCHLGHHLRNRTDHEIFDMYYPHDNKALKYIQFYGIFTGPYWVTVVSGCVLLLFAPWVFTLGEKQKGWIKSADFAMLVPLANHPDRWRMRFEVLYSFGFQALLFVLLGLRFKAWLLCYFIFALQWGSLQYADHAWSVRDIREGAWNLKVSRITRAFFLNYHYHLVHHRYPMLPWTSLPRYLDRRDPMPSFWSIYFSMWRGPRPVNSPPPPAIEKQLAEMLQ